ncbi:MAG: type II secretion system F family protein, partial [Pirellulales bacterium]|nr:type II secretion system F family protein [Pirellulales bacterium]
MNALLNRFFEVDFLFGFFAALAVAATVITLGMPFLQSNSLSTRMKYVASEREEIRKRERARLNAESNKRGSLRGEPKPFIRDVVDRLNLRRIFSSDETVNKMKMAGFRGQAPLNVFLFLRAVLPIVFFLAALAYLFSLPTFDQPAVVKVLLAAGVGFLGVYAPNIYVQNRITRRQDSIRLAWPDSLDLMLICVESGQSIEVAFRRVAQEIGLQSVELAEEMALTTAELSYLEDRKKAFENLGKRTGLDGVKAVMTSLIQAERYGTPLGTALRVMSQENRDIRMAAAEKKAAALPPKL